MEPSIMGANIHFLHKNNFNDYIEIESKLIINGCTDKVTDISIMIPTYNRPHLLRESVRSALSQNTHLHIEVVVVDNSTDMQVQREIDHLINELLPAPIKLYRNTENIGMFGNWNRCITLAKSPWISILNDDDIIHSDFLEKMWLFRDENTISFCRTIRFGSKLKTYTTKSKKIRRYIFSKLKNKRDTKFEIVNQYDVLYGNPLNGTLGAIIPRKIALELGGYNERLWPTSDYDFIVRAMFSGINLKKINADLAYYRVEENESLKVKTLEGFLKNDYLMRMSIINSSNHSNLRKFFLRNLAAHQARIIAYLMYPQINENFDPCKNLLGIQVNSKKPVCIINPFSKLLFFWKILWLPLNSNPKEHT